MKRLIVEQSQSSTTMWCCKQDSDIRANMDNIEYNFIIDIVYKNLDIADFVSYVSYINSSGLDRRVFIFGLY